MKKYIAVIGVLAVISIGYWLYNSFVTNMPKSGDTTAPTQTDDISDTVGNNSDTSDWLTYTNEKFGYEVKYPKTSTVDTDFINGGSINIDSVVTIPSQLQRERDAAYGQKTSDPGVSIRIDNPTTKYRTPCEWFYSERDNFADINAYDKDICTKGSITPYRNATGVITTFNGEPAYIFSREYDGIDGGLYAGKGHTIVFFHDGRPWEIGYGTLPDNPTDKWKNHPYYTYLEQSVPITKAILDSFKFTM